MYWRGLDLVGSNLIKNKVNLATFKKKKIDTVWIRKKSKLIPQQKKKKVFLCKGNATKEKEREREEEGGL